MEKGFALSYDVIAEMSTERVGEQLVSSVQRALDSIQAASAANAAAASPATPANAQKVVDSANAAVAALTGNPGMKMAHGGGSTLAALSAARIAAKSAAKKADVAVKEALLALRQLQREMKVQSGGDPESMSAVTGAINATLQTKNTMSSLSGAAEQLGPTATSTASMVLSSAKNANRSIQNAARILESVQQGNSADKMVADILNMAQKKLDHQQAVLVALKEMNGSF